MGTLIKDNAVILFQGDSITDCGRNRENACDLGNGYALMAAAMFSVKYPEKNVKFINKGINGETVEDLRNRWQQDCIDIAPDWVSILVGVNDCWHMVSPEKFEEAYRFILTEIKQKLNAGIIICEPFLLQVDEEKINWRKELDPKIQVARKLAREFGAIYVPFDGIFAQASTKREPLYWVTDGLHPSAAGNALMAKAWLEAIDA